MAAHHSQGKRRTVVVGTGEVQASSSLHKGPDASQVPTLSRAMKRYVAKV
jgi:hypothetical protein